MRDIIVTLLVFGSLPFILRNAYIGVLVWSWLSYMNPHRLAWGFAYDMPFAQIVAVTLFLSLLFSKEKQRLPGNFTIFVWVTFIIWMAISSFNAEYPEAAKDMYFQILKVQILTFITMVLITDIKKLNQLIWVIVCSIGYFSVKGGIFTLLTGGAFRVYGPPSSNITENNALAVAVLMVIPLMIYLYHISTHKWVRYGLIFGIVLSVISVLGSQSRGAIVAILGVGCFFWLKTKTKLVSGLSLVLLASLLLAFMPESWHERMESIYNYQEDDSAMQRINSWQYSINVANDRLTGGGLQSWSKGMFATYAPNPEWVFVAHSIYFSVLADHGWLGLIMFLLILGLTWRRLSMLIKRTKGERNASFNLLARMLQVSLVAYMSGGIFLSLSYFDLPWHLIAIVILLPQFLNKLEEGVSEVNRQNVAKASP